MVVGYALFYFIFFHSTPPLSLSTGIALMPSGWYRFLSGGEQLLLASEIAFMTA